MRFTDLSDFFYYTAISYPLVLGKSRFYPNQLTKLAIVLYNKAYPYYDRRLIGAKGDKKKRRIIMIKKEASLESVGR